MKRDTQSRVGFGLIGAGGQARELAGHCNRPIDFYAVDRQYFVTGQQCVPLEAPGRYALKFEAVIAIGAPGAKRKAFEKGPGLLFGTVLANTAVLASTVIIGEGTVVAPGAFVGGAGWTTCAVKYVCHC